jgi:enhancing lycopene biosynthesis protein 2
MGAQHVECSVNDCVVDKEFNVVSTPAYMLAGSIAQAAAGIEKTITTLKGMLKS